MASTSRAFPRTQLSRSAYIVSLLLVFIRRGVLTKSEISLRDAKALMQIYLLAALSTYYWEQDPDLKAKLKGPAYQKLPVYLDKLEAQVKSNGGHFVRGKVNN